MTLSTPAGVHPLVAARDDEFREAYGFGIPVAMPAYGGASRGPWSLASRRGGVGEGYVSTNTVEAPYHVLRRDGVTWMSTAFLELESHAWHLHKARGLVAVAGLGMGLYACAAAARPEVDEVVVAEVDADVIALFGLTADHAPEVACKVRIVHGDAAGPAFADALGGRRPDYLYADIWPTYPDPDAPGWTRGLVEGLRPHEAGWWGQEAAFAHRCLDGGIDMDEAALGTFLNDVGVPCVVTGGYAAFCRDVATAHGLVAEMPGPP